MFESVCDCLRSALSSLVPHLFTFSVVYLFSCLPFQHVVFEDVVYIVVSCLVCIVVNLCVFVVLCVSCCFYFRCRTAG